MRSPSVVKNPIFSKHSFALCDFWPVLKFLAYITDISPSILRIPNFGCADFRNLWGVETIANSIAYLRFDSISH